MAVAVLYFYAKQGDVGFSAGQEAPAWVLQNGQGKGTSLADYKGKVVLLSFWATWCPPCVHEIPSLNALQRRFASEGLVVLGVNLDDEGWEAIRLLEKRIPIGFPVVWDEQATVSNLYHVEHLPQSYLISREGRILQELSGGIDEGDEEVVSLIQETLRIP
ncbi:MAG: TlpA disulfide reductase family protein [bacterium]|nr:TlpA disulfide reductase family protein [bacterium]